MDERQMRFECLQLASRDCGAVQRPEDVVARARAYADFVLAHRDGEIVAAARELAEKVSRGG